MQNNDMKNTFKTIYYKNNGLFAMSFAENICHKSRILFNTLV